MASDHPRAEFGPRFGAFLLDYLIVSTAANVLVVPFFVWWTVTRIEPREDPVATPGELLSALGIMLAVIVLLTYVYFVELMFRSGQTLGKRVLRIQVVAQAPGASLTRSRAAARWLLQWVGGVCVPPLFYLDGLWQLWDGYDRQCLHDKLARTAVVRLPLIVR